MFKLRQPKSIDQTVAGFWRPFVGIASVGCVIAAMNIIGFLASALLLMQSVLLYVVPPVTTIRDASAILFAAMDYLVGLPFGEMAVILQLASQAAIAVFLFLGGKKRIASGICLGVLLTVLGLYVLL